MTAPTSSSPESTRESLLPCPGYRTLQRDPSAAAAMVLSYQHHHHQVRILFRNAPNTHVTGCRVRNARKNVLFLFVSLPRPGCLMWLMTNISCILAAGQYYYLASTFEYFNHFYKKKLEECCILSTLQRLEISDPSKEQNTIMKVARQQFFIILCVVQPISLQTKQSAKFQRKLKQFYFIF